MTPARPTAPDPTASLTRPDRGPVWLRVGALFDGREARRDAHLVFDAAGVRHAGGPPPPSVLRPGQTAPDLHLPGHTALPGLIEAHGHFFLEGGEEQPAQRAGSLELSDAALLARAQPRLARLLRLGIVGVRDAGDRRGVGLALQRRSRSAARGAMPYVDSPGAAIHHQGRYGAFMGRPLEEHGGIEAAIAARVAEGAAHIKLLATGIINFEKGAVTARPQIPADELTRAVAAARAHGRQTMIHSSGHDGVAHSIAARVDTIEHGFFIDREQLARLRDLDIAWVPTFAPVQYQLDKAAALGWSDLVRAPHHADGFVAIMDIGTNTELFLGNRHKLLAASCPAGPAFEGRAITCGMPGLDGAIARVVLSDDGAVQSTTVIGGGEPEGICGSGLIDLLGELRRTGRMNAYGRFEDGAHAFVLDAARRIELRESDINELAQAKGANIAGLAITAKHYGRPLASLDRFYLAGGFGRHLDLAAARRIGLIPDLPGDKITVVGNAAIEGATLALLSVRRRRELEEAVKTIGHVQLETDPDFFDHFVAGCQFHPFGAEEKAGSLKG